MTSAHVGMVSNGELGAEADFAPGIEKVFNLYPMESSYFVEDLVGQIPPYLCGSYYVNGPATFSRGDLHYRNWLDGDGMVCRLRFNHGAVHFANRFVGTTKFNVEQKAGRAVFRTFGTAFRGDALKRGIALESPGNVSVYPFHDILLAFGEQALPWRLDPDTLETIGPFHFGGMLNEVTPFAAHPKFDPKTGEMFNFGTFFSAARPKLCLYCFDQTGNLRLRASYPMQHSHSIHDFGLSQSYMVFYVSPYLLDINAMLHENLSLMDSLQWWPERGSQLLVFSRATGENVASVSLPGRFCLHLINCFEERQRLIADVIELERPVYDQYQPLPDLFTHVSDGGAVRLIVDLETKRLVSRQELEYRRAPDFPSIDPASTTLPYSEFWMLGVSRAGNPGRKFFDELVHVRWGEPQTVDIFRAEPGCYLGSEPIFLGCPGSTEGAVICQQFDVSRANSSFLIFDSRNVRAGPVSILRLKDALPFGFHASFDPILHN
jgi:all-trans-8'-apo-beta-carotenal 15,15'-oxygenase